MTAYQKELLEGLTLIDNASRNKPLVVDYGSTQSVSDNKLANVMNYIRGKQLVKMFYASPNYVAIIK